jgi:uncharacterized cupin superfamily protein
MVNIYDPKWVERDYAPLCGRTARIGAPVGSKQLGATHYEIDPGQNGSPFHGGAGAAAPRDVHGAFKHFGSTQRQ